MCPIIIRIISTAYRSATPSDRFSRNFDGRRGSWRIGAIRDNSEVNVYEKKDGSVEIAAMNIGMMGGMFSGEVKEVLTDGGERLDTSLREIIK